MDDDVYLTTILPILNGLHIENECTRVYKQIFMSANIARYGAHKDIKTTVNHSRELDRQPDLAYNRKRHFIKCLDQYECVQLVKIDANVYNKLYKKLKDCGLYVVSEDGTTCYTLSKHQLLQILKDIHEPAHNLNLIYATITKSAKPLVRLKREAILENFKRFVDAYTTTVNNLQSKRKNFINVRHLLFQILNNMGHSCELIDFGIGDYPNKTSSYNLLFATVFKQLNWTLY